MIAFRRVLTVGGTLPQCEQSMVKVFNQRDLGAWWLNALDVVFERLKNGLRVALRQLCGDNLEERLVHGDVRRWVVELSVDLRRLEYEVIGEGEADFHGRQLATEGDDRVDQVGDVSFI